MAFVSDVFSQVNQQDIDLGNIDGDVISDSGDGSVEQYNGYNSDQDKYNNQDNGGSGNNDLLYNAGNEQAALKGNQGQVKVHQNSNGNGNANTITNAYSKNGNSRITYKVANIGANIQNGTGANNVSQNRNLNNGTNVFVNQQQ